MNWKPYLILVALPLIFSVLQTAAASTPTMLPGSSHSVLRVLINVDSNGKIAKASPAAAVQPAVKHMLLRMLKHAISQPAHDAAGNPVASSFIMQLSMQTSPAANGKYQIRLAYRSIKTLPTGSWIWCRTRGQPHLINVGMPGVVCPAPYQTPLNRDLFTANPLGSFTRASFGKR